MRSSAFTVEEYLAELPDERREVIETVRQVILNNSLTAKSILTWLIFAGTLAPV